MGLLDDAIREHLDLKRRRGADPDEVAREQREALNAAAERQVASIEEDGGNPAEATPVDTAIDSPESDGDAASTMDHVGGEDSSVLRTSHAAGAGETAELDMSSVLGDDGEEQEQGAPPAQAAIDEPSNASARPVAARPATDEDSPEEDSLEWEVPGEEVPGEVSEEEAEKPAEDVLEETPDFLRDTPEEDRLWFEQQPPRDFDFDK
jgi:hypothetical protein